MSDSDYGNASGNSTAGAKSALYPLVGTVVEGGGGTRLQITAQAATSTGGTAQLSIAFVQRPRMRRVAGIRVNPLPEARRGTTRVSGAGETV